jgi:hypothetical protein
VFLQDIKHRAVWNYILFLLIAAGCFLFFKSTDFVYFKTSLFINSVITINIIIIILLIAKLVLKKSMFDVIGMGDILFFIFVAMSFPLVSFIIIFAFALLFSLTLHLLMINSISTYRKRKTIPLAGFMSIFIIIIYAFHWLGFYPQLYYT